MTHQPHVLVMLQVVERFVVHEADGNVHAVHELLLALHAAVQHRLEGVGLTRVWDVEQACQVSVKVQYMEKKQEHKHKTSVSPVTSRITNER